MPSPDRGQEGLEVVVEIVFGDPQIPTEQAEKLPLHQIDFCQAEAEVLEAGHSSVACPVLVLRRGVVEVLGSKDERG